MTHDRDVVPPRGRGHPNWFGARVKLGEKSPENSKSAGAWKRLRDGDAIFGQNGGVVTVSQLNRGLEKLGDLMDVKIDENQWQTRETDANGEIMQLKSSWTGVIVL